MTRLYALDLGSTQFKAGFFLGNRLITRSERLPSLNHSLNRYETPVKDWVLRAQRVLQKSKLPSSEPAELVLCTQRSSFLLWNKKTKVPLTPLISWRDTRAQAWCRRHQSQESFIKNKTGLVLSPHYVGPKIASLIENTQMQKIITSGDILFGTLDSYLTWLWSGGDFHQMDLSMAARTLLLNLKTCEWDSQLLDLFKISKTILPQLTESTHSPQRLNSGLNLVGNLADQSAAALAILTPNTVLINLGTGGFVLKPIKKFQNKSRYLTTLLSHSQGQPQYALEGTINGIAELVNSTVPDPVTLNSPELPQNTWCFPDIGGWGAPHWRSDLSTLFSKAVETLSPQQKKRVILEGIVFRIIEILEDLIEAGEKVSFFLSGGLSREPFIAQALSSILESPIKVCDEKEITLVGALSLASSEENHPISYNITQCQSKQQLKDKYFQWRQWVSKIETCH